MIDEGADWLPAYLEERRAAFRACSVEEEEAPYMEAFRAAGILTRSRAQAYVEHPDARVFEEDETPQA
jgi:hypothetical protein